MQITLECLFGFSGLLCGAPAIEAQCGTCQNTQSRLPPYNAAIFDPRYTRDLHLYFSYITVAFFFIINSRFKLRGDAFILSINHLFQTPLPGLSCSTVDPSALEQDYETIPQ